MSIWIEESPTSRATCKICDNRIKKGEVRVGGIVGSGFFPYYYHLECFMKENEEFVKELVKVALVKYIGEEGAKPVILAIELGR